MAPLRRVDECPSMIASVASAMRLTPGMRDARILDGGEEPVGVNVEVLESGDEVEVLLDHARRIVGGVDDDVAVAPFPRARAAA